MPDEDASLGPFVYGTDGKGAPNLIVRAGACRLPHSVDTSRELIDDNGNIRSADNLYMDGPEVFAFTMEVVPALVSELLARAHLNWADVDIAIFHQANGQMLEHLRNAIDIPPEKFYISLADCGNTVSSTIPIALKRAIVEGHVQRGSRVMLVGFGVGYSWGGTFLRWRGC
jgi:3-oxoacyl-[acyl-carrier-protein] synthase-3